MHGEDDQIVPIGISGRKSAKLIKGAKEIFYPGLPYGLTTTNADQVNADLAGIPEVGSTSAQDISLNALRRADRVRIFSSVMPMAKLCASTFRSHWLSKASHK
jgi:hypothetical protein